MAREINTITVTAGTEIPPVGEDLSMNGKMYRVVYILSATRFDVREWSIWRYMWSAVIDFLWIIEDGLNAAKLKIKKRWQPERYDSDV